MTVKTTVCFPSIAQFLHMSVLIYFSGGYVCAAQLRMFDSNPEYVPTGFFHENISSSGYSSPLIETVPLKTLERRTSLRNAIDEGLETTTATRRYQSTENEGTELESLEVSDDYADYGNLNLSYVGPEVLLDLEPDEMILSHDQAPSQRIQKPVRDGFARPQAMELLRLHNFYRGNVTPPAGDMFFMEWDESLAEIAQRWADQCAFKHGFPLHSYPGAMGQNLYMGMDPTGVRALLLWYEEYQFYNLQTLTCLADKQCGHYTQMVWGKSVFVGCGMKRCGSRKFYVVCHYSPPGNIVGHSPYVVSKPCSQCDSDSGGLCTNKLCVSRHQCSRNPENCDPTCPLECHNCGILKSDTCKCSCADGWDSLDCSRRCTDKHESCGKNPGWPTAGACYMNQNAVADVYCRKMCGKCHGVEDASSSNTCCNGAVCGDGYVLDKSLCKCRLLCPGPKCDHSEDSGSLRHTKNVFLILFALYVRMTFLQ